MSTKTTSSEQYGHRTIGTAAELALDATGGKWVVVCEDHKTVVNVATQKAARTTATVDFCDACRGTDEQPETAALAAEEPEQAASTTEPGERPEADAVKDWRGNYNTVFAPAAELLAPSGLTVWTVSVSTMLKQTHIAGALAKSFLNQLAQMEEDAVAALRTWQKTQDRNGQTDMEKFNQNRSFLAGYLAGAKKPLPFAKDMDKALRPDALAAGAAARKGAA